MESFFAFINRMKYIDRWSLMRNTEKENLMEHSYMVATVAHALANISNIYFGGSVDANKVAAMALFHDVSEIVTGDMPTPIKYLNEDLKKNYKQIETLAQKRLVELLPQEMQGVYDPVFDNQDEDYKFVKYADKLCAYIKCILEIKYGNSEFLGAKQAIKQSLEDFKSKEVDFFVQHFSDAFLLPLDQLKL